MAVGSCPIFLQISIQIEIGSNLYSISKKLAGTKKDLDIFIQKYQTKKKLVATNKIL